MKQAIEDWVNWMHGRRLSLTTVSGYVWELERLAVKHPGLGAFDFRARHLNQYLAERRLLDGVGVASSRHTVCALKSFFGYVCGGAKSPARGLPYPRVPKKVQRSLSFEQLCAVLAACDTSTPKGKRDVALMCVLADTGLRASEVCRLRLADVELAGGWLKVVVKGGDEEVGIFTSYTAAQIGAWLTVRERYAKAEAVTLFVSLRSGQALTRNGLKTELLKIGARAGVRLCAHMFRRGMASITTENGGPSRLVRDQGRWHTEAMFEQYSRYARLEGLRRFLPLAGLMTP